MESRQDISEETKNKQVTISYNETNDSNAKLLKEAYSFIEVKEKLVNYCQHNTSAKDRWLIACHAHCFIVLS